MGKKNRRLQATVHDIIFEDQRELTKEEFKNVQAKQGSLNADFFRHNMFNASARGKRVLYKKPKVVWEKSDTDKVAISHSLHQKHADVLSLIHTDCIAMTKPDKTGGYFIYVSLYRIAKLMGYKNPSKDTDKVKKWISELRHTSFITYSKDGDFHTTILSDAFFSKNKDVFLIEVRGRNAKILAHTTGIRIDKALTHDIVSIPDRLSKLKAVIRYVISNKRTRHGYTLKHIMEKLEIGRSNSLQVQRNQITDFRKQIRENGKILANFNLEYDAKNEKILYHEQHPMVTFELPIKADIRDRIISGTSEDLIACRKHERNYDSMVSRLIKVDHTVYTIEAVKPNMDDPEKIDVVLYNHNTGKRGTAAEQTAENVWKYIDSYK